MLRLLFCKAATLYEFADTCKPVVPTILIATTALLRADHTLLRMVRTAGIEPARITTLEPKSSASTNSATFALY
jgi:hypothetical protein